MKLNVVAGWIVGVGITFALGSLVPETTCSDGWRSPSIGRMGACSHHGGVKSYGFLYIFILGISVGAGSCVSHCFAKKEVPVAPIAKPSNKTGGSRPTFSSDVQMITDAIENKGKIEFLYKKPNELSHTKRTIWPMQLHSVAHEHNAGRTLCVKGYCELRKDMRSFALKRMRALRIV